MIIWLILTELFHADGAVNEGRGTHITEKNQTWNQTTKKTQPHKQTTTNDHHQTQSSSAPQH